MKALVGAFNQEKALVGAFFVIVQPVVEPIDRFTALICMETSPPPPPTCSGVCNLATERLTLLLSYYHYIDFMYVAGGIFVLFVYFNCYMFYFLLIFG